MDIAWYLVLSAFIFARCRRDGAQRSLVILICPS